MSRKPDIAKAVKLSLEPTTSVSATDCFRSSPKTLPMCSFFSKKSVDYRDVSNYQYYIILLKVPGNVLEFLHMSADFFSFDFGAKQPWESEDLPNDLKDICLKTISFFN